MKLAQLSLFSSVIMSTMASTFGFQVSHLSAIAAQRGRFAGVGRNNIGIKGTLLALFSSSTSSGKSKSNKKEQSSDDYIPPWNDVERLLERSKGGNPFRSRQHVNPLARRFQMPTVLTPDWPRDMFDDLSRPLFLDIGCSRGGFLLDVAKKSKEGGGGDDDDNIVARYNFLGLEIRPIVVYHAQERVARHDLQGILGFVGCNANVDLERLLTLAEAEGNLKMVTIQFPDPHFKTQHAKRRVVTPKLVTSLARFMPEGATVFLQSDVQMVLDDMREKFRDQSEYFQDSVADASAYGVDNIFGVPTEREVSVLERDLPVYRALFTRTEAAVPADDKDEQ